jgi:hypothetical protein
VRCAAGPVGKDARPVIRQRHRLRARHVQDGRVLRHRDVPRTFWNAFESPDPSRSKRIAFADFLAVNTYPALGVTKLDVKGAKHKHLTSWVSGYERALDLFLDA